MAVRHIFIARPPEAVWATLADGRKYAEWVVGARKIRAANVEWPQIGAEIHFVVGYGPLKLHDRTVVRVCEPPQRLELEVHAGPLGTTRVAIQLIAWGEGTVLILDEHPLRGLSAGLHGPHIEMLLHLRNRVMLRNLARVAENIQPEQVGAHR
jgi:uncharacterized protein YndB with AHSA1/START domain